MNSYQYTNTSQGALSIACDTVADPANILTVDRNGIGMQQGVFSGGDIEADLYEFLLKQRDISSPTIPGRYHIILSTVYMSPMVITTEIGPVIIDGTEYFFIEGPGEVGYFAQVGDTTEVVRDALIVAINAFPSWTYSTTATPISTNRIQITVATPIYTNAGFYANIFKSGYFVRFSLNGGPIKDYLVDVNENVFAYPIPSAPEPSYLWTELTLAPVGIATLLLEPGHNLVSYTPNLAGTTLITDSPQLGTVPPGKYVYFNSFLYFADPLNLGEYIKMIVI